MSRSYEKPREEFRKDACEFCGMTSEEHEEERGRALEVHHILPHRSDGPNTYRNLITVCLDCHWTLETTQARAIAELCEKLEAATENAKEPKEATKVTVEVDSGDSDMSEEDIRTIVRSEIEKVVHKDAVVGFL